MNDKRLAEIEAREAKATKGPWDTIKGSLVRAIKGEFAVPIFRSEAPIDWHIKKNLTHKVMRQAYADEVNNATFIAHARDDVPWMAAQLHARDAAVTAAIDMIENCAGVPAEPDSLPQMLLHHLRAALNPEVKP